MQFIFFAIASLQDVSMRFGTRRTLCVWERQGEEDKNFENAECKLNANSISLYLRNFFELFT